MEVRKICQWCGKPFIAQKTTPCYCSHQCSNLGYKERIRERKRQLKRSQELLQPRQAAEGQDFFSFAQAAKLMGVTRQYIYKLVKESKLRASRISGKKSLIRRADIELMMKTKPYERIMPKEDFGITEYYTAEEIAEKYNIPTTLLCDTNHILYSDYSEVIVVGAGADAVDYKLISICHKGDVVVSQDYGVAAMALGKGAYAIHQSGKWYTNENIDQMLMERHLNKKVRRSSHKNHIRGPRKRTEDDDVRFAQSFEKLILMAKSKEGAQSGTI